MLFLKRMTFVWVIVMGFSVLALSQEEGNKEEAKKHFELGKAYYKQSEYTKAIDEFQKAYSLYPHSVILYNIAQAYEKEGNIPMALRYFREYLRASPNAEDKNIILISIQNLEKKLQEKGIQQVGIYSTPPEADVAINGKIVGKTPFTIELKPGKYTLSLTKKGYIPIDREFIVTPDRSLELDFSLNEINVGTAKSVLEEKRETVLATDNKKEDIKPSEVVETKSVISRADIREGKRFWTYILGGTGLLAIGTGVVFGIMASSSESDLKSDKNRTRTQDEVQTIADNAQKYAMLANVFYGAGAACLISATVLYFIEGKEGKGEPSPRFSIFPYRENLVLSIGARF